MPKSCITQVATRRQIFLLPGRRAGAADASEQAIGVIGALEIFDDTAFSAAMAFFANRAFLENKTLADMLI
jgi:hypothetical protein